MSASQVLNTPTY